MFLTELVMRECPGEFWGGRQVWELEQDLVWEHPVFGYRLVARQGMKTDLASTPWFVHWYLPPSGVYNKAAVIHDMACETTSWFEAAAIFRMLLGELRVSRSRIAVMYYSVLWYGRHRNVRQQRK